MLNYLVVFILVFLLNTGIANAHHGCEGITGVGVAGPIITIPAYTLPKGLKFINLLTDYTNFDTFSNKKLIELDKRHEHVHDTANLFTPSVGVGYGLTDNLTIGLRLPYVFRFGIKDVHDADVGKAGNSIGIGDITLFGQYRFLKNEKRNLHAALLAGLKIPSGVKRTRARDGDLFEADEQPGSGSWDPLIGIAISKKLGNISLDANGLYKFATRGSQGSDLGDIVNYNLAISYRLIRDGDFYEKSKSHNLNKKLSFDLILEANGLWSQKPNTIYGFVDENHGGTLVYLSPGFRFTYNKKWIWSLSTGLPVVHDLNGRQRAPNIRLVTGITRAF
ncbi:MAG: transporter [Candidatus Melainabacteria bacterium]|nr:transporter [Candidatus Melainabacteria bacterium]